MKEAILYEKFKDKLVKCHVCNHYCAIADGKRGFCGVRQNQGGVLYSLNYGKVIAAHIDPIEKKPFFHFLPGSFSYSISAAGCNFRCAQCQNWEISQAAKLYPEEIPGEEFFPHEIVAEALKNKCPSISYTYTEPTIFVELALETMKIAKEKGLKNCWVSNGYMSKETIEEIAPYLDAANIDLKFFTEENYQKVCQAKLAPVLETLKELRKRKTRAQNNFVLGRAHKICAPIWLEITTLLIPDLTDKDKQIEGITKFIKKELGDDVPWHISRFHPDYQMTDKKMTPDENLNQAYEIGKKAGLKYIYFGNVVNDSRENTYCPKCNELNIERIGYQITRFDKNGRCRKCKNDINLVIE